MRSLASCLFTSSGQNSPPKGRCYLSMKITEMIAGQNRTALRSEDLVGLNATLMFALQNIRRYRVFEEVDQVSLHNSRRSK